MGQSKKIVEKKYVLTLNLQCVTQEVTGQSSLCGTGCKFLSRNECKADCQVSVSSQRARNSDQEKGLEGKDK